eukprot:gb/GECH01006861.1/.p1 GENE.gb/GECH01006861.1/~~gb/GECH01006861.1/.p1  ORF type:complete len:145 (+),score=45.25 gb/GECH01006861.1/:1-435(+)
MASYFSEHHMQDDHGYTDHIQEQIKKLLEENERRMMGHRPPASKTAVRQLEVEIISDKQIKEGLNCIVCQDEYQLNELVKKMPCEHIFHPKCLDMWLEKDNSCPTCRTEILTDDPEYEMSKKQKNDDKTQGYHDNDNNFGFMYM